ncbi:MAG: glycosyltransferase N-terminal domain-containing protein [Chthoniobacteraceae bacterium]
MAPIDRSLPPDTRLSLRIYNLLFPIVLLALLPGVLLRMFRRGGFREKFGQRLAFYSAEDLVRFRSREWLWIHSISVGETFIALKLARAIHGLDPNAGILLSTTTSTGFAEARKAAGDWLEPIYNPIDSRRIVRRALDAVKPRKVFLIEGEAWPNFVAECWRRDILVSLVNARLSPRSERRFQRWRRWTGPIFRLLDRVFVPEPDDVSRWKNLGVEPSRLICTGSIKFDQPAISSTREAEFRALLATLGVAIGAPILVAGSTWHPEESTLAEVVLSLRTKHPDLFLILVPRHVERFPEIIRQLAPLGLKIVRRSQPPPDARDRPDVLLIDVTGELRDWYALATVTFIGKSLPGIAEVGGQNPAEPAALGKPIVFGPHMENFAALVAGLLRVEAAVQIQTAADLLPAFAALLASPDRRASLGEHARVALAAHAGATARTATLLMADER